ncbi:hypothetical protein GCM10009844_11730 [Nocardioides koreensis]|uniref:Uncharacterized protein n=1 Tax=Nocardioides koreensis TaxID=433651 RepID=A0ABP5L3L1_9ACTN
MPDEPDLGPEQEQEVRRLLADARHTEPVPADVATRLDRVLADLAAQHGGSPDDEADNVVAMASRRRRRVTSVLVAAAAVVAIGVGLDQVVDSGGSGESASTADRATVAESGGAGSGSDQGKDEPAPGADSLTNSGAAPEQALTDPVRVRPDHFSADVARARQLTHRSAAYYAPDVQALKDASGKIDCTPGDWGSGTFVPVVYDGHRGVLAFRAANGDTQVVDLFGCGGSSVLRSITLPAP